MARHGRREVGDPARDGGADVPFFPGWSLRLVVVLACLVQLGLGLVWSTLQPAFKGYDEPQHAAGSLWIAYHHEWPAPKQLPVPYGLAAAVQAAGGNDVRPPAAVVPRGQRGSLDEYGGFERTSGTSQMSQHPPLYYAIDAAAVRLVPGADHLAYDRVLAIMRWVSALLLAPLPLLAFAAMRRLTADRSLLAGAALAPLLVPGLARIGGSVSNDALIVTAFAAASVFVVHLLTGDLRRRTALLGGGATLLALLAKATALLLVPWVVAVYLGLLLARRDASRGGDRRAVLTSALCWSAPTLIGLTWWARNLVAFGSVQPNGSTAVTPTMRTHAYGEFVTSFFSGISYRFWSALGNPEPPGLDRGLTVAATCTVLALVVVGVATFRRRGRLLVVLLGPVLVLASVTAPVLGSYLRTSTLSGVQGRYLYPAVLGLAVPALFGVGAILRARLRPLVPVAVAVFVVLLQLAAAADTLRFSWQPVDGSVRDGVHQLLAWAPYPVGVTVAFAVVLVAVAVALVPAVLVATRTGWLASRTRSPEPVG